MGRDEAMIAGLIQAQGEATIITDDGPQGAAEADPDFDANLIEAGIPGCAFRRLRRKTLPAPAVPT